MNIASNFKFLSTLSLRRATEVSGDTWQRGSNFYPRSPCGERQRRFIGQCVQLISIHALLAESDSGEITGGYDRNDFYPRSPCGERRLELFLIYQDNQFLSTLSLRRATIVHQSGGRNGYISIHALLAESDRGVILSLNTQ